MDKQTLKNKLIETHDSFVNVITGLPDDAFLKNQNEKWSAAQQLDHIYRSVKPVRQALGFPKFLLRMIWGRANRESASYDELVKKYAIKLADGGKAQGRFVPQKPGIGQRQSLITGLRKEVSGVCSRIDSFTEDDLDSCILPHPSLGKLTIREMLYFTIYHVKHHEVLTIKNLQDWSISPL
jgi:hypothetical protein